jgi:hypothetical protein
MGSGESIVHKERDESSTTAPDYEKRNQPTAGVIRRYLRDIEGCGHRNHTNGNSADDPPDDYPGDR